MNIDIKNYEDLITCEESLTSAITELALIKGEETNSLNEVQGLLKSVPYLLRKIHPLRRLNTPKNRGIIANILYGVINEKANQNSTNQPLAYA